MGIKHYDKSFKEQAVALSHQRGNVSAVAQKSGISSSQLSKWCSEIKIHKDQSFLGRGIERLTDEQREMKNLKKTLKNKNLNLEIFKKAIIFFSRTDK